MAKNKQRSFSVIIVSDALEKNREYTISSGLIKKIFLSCAVLIFVFAFFIYSYLNLTFDKERMKNLEKEIIASSNLISKSDHKVRGLEQELAKIEAWTEKALVTTGLKSSVKLGSMGGGGPESIEVTEYSPAESGLAAAEQSLDDQILDRAQKINQTAKQVQKTLLFVSNVVSQQKQRLNSTPSIWPVTGYISDSFGFRTHPITGKKDYHKALDIANQIGTPILAPADGTVILAEWKPYYGNLIIVDHGFEYQTRYGHLASFKVKFGDRIKRGQIIAYLGKTGRCTAPHLHYEVRYRDKPQNPLNYFIAD